MSKISEPIDITPEDSVAPIYLVPLTQEQIIEREAFAAQVESDLLSIQTAESVKLSAIAKLAALGLTEEEAKAIVGV
jgi:hypothetical protein